MSIKETKVPSKNVKKEFSLHFLATEEMLAKIPSNVTLVANYGYVGIVVKGTLTVPYFSGDHVIIRGTRKNVRAYLRSCGKVWIGQGPVMMQDFEVVDCPTVLEGD